MQITFAGERMNLLGEDHSLIGYIMFPGVKKGLVNVSELYLIREWRGKGYEDQMLEALCMHLREQEKKMILTCPSAQRYMAEHPEYVDLLPRDIHFEKH